MADRKERWSGQRAVLAAAAGACQILAWKVRSESSFLAPRVVAASQEQPVKVATAKASVHHPQLFGQLSPTGILTQSLSLCACAAAFAQSHRSRRRTESQRSLSVQCRAESMGAGGAIHTFAIPGDVNVAKLAQKCASLANYFDLGCVVFFTVGISPDVISSAAAGALGLHGACPVFIADADGAVGWDDAEGKNIVLKSEAGDRGVVVVGFRGGGHSPTSCKEGAGAKLPEGCSLHMVVTSGDVPGKPPEGAVYGGKVKACYELEHSGDLVEVAQWAVSSPFAVVAPCADGAVVKAVDDAWEALPPVAQPPLGGGCFTSAAVEAEEAAKISKVRLFGVNAPSFGPDVGDVLKCIPGAMKWGSLLDDDPRPDVSADEGSAYVVLYGK